MIQGRHVLAILAGILAILATGLLLDWLATVKLGLPLSPFVQTIVVLGLPPLATLTSVLAIGHGRCGLPWSAFGFRRVGASAILRAIGAWLLFLPVVAALIYAMFRITGATAIGRQIQLIPALGALEPWQMPILAALIAVAAPVAEETLFRGVLFGWLRRHWPFWPSAFLSALVFSLLHMILEVMPPTIALGLLFAWMYERSRSLWTPIAVHMVHNGVVFAVTLLALRQGVPLGGH
ncbi:MAG: type II CAAX endopeptidase family protein [Alphaproteobacteria bacterium]